VDVLQYFVDHVLTPFAGNPHLGLFLVVWFSAIFPLAPPEEAFTLVGGYYIAKGILQPIPTAAAILAGIILTNDTQYWMGRGVLKLLSGTKLGHRIICSRSFQRSEEVMHKKGLWAIVGCRFFFGTRAPTYVAAGFLRFPFWRFFIVDSSVVLLHGIPFMVVGYLFADGIKKVVDSIEQLGIWSLVLLVAFVASVILIRYWLGKRRPAREACRVCDAADPEPVPPDSPVE
jgi:membrane protein DedA with SNARE-associated domain